MLHQWFSDSSTVISVKQPPKAVYTIEIRVHAGIQNTVLALGQGVVMEQWKTTALNMHQKSKRYG